MVGSKAWIFSVAIKAIGVGGFVGLLIAGRHSTGWGDELRWAALAWLLALGAVKWRIDAMKRWDANRPGAPDRPPERHSDAASAGSGRAP